MSLRHYFRRMRQKSIKNQAIADGYRLAIARAKLQSDPVPAMFWICMTATPWDYLDRPRDAFPTLLAIPPKDGAIEDWLKVFDAAEIESGLQRLDLPLELLGHLYRPIARRISATGPRGETVPTGIKAMGWSIPGMLMHTDARLLWGIFFEALTPLLPQGRLPGLLEPQRMPVIEPKLALGSLGRPLGQWVPAFRDREGRVHDVLDLAVNKMDLQAVQITLRSFDEAPIDALARGGYLARQAARAHDAMAHEVRRAYFNRFVANTPRRSAVVAMPREFIELNSPSSKIAGLCLRHGASLPPGAWSGNTDRTSFGEDGVDTFAPRDLEILARGFVPFIATPSANSPFAGQASFAAPQIAPPDLGHTGQQRLSRFLKASPVPLSRVPKVLVPETIAKLKATDGTLIPLCHARTMSLAVLVDGGHADVAAMSAEHGFSPLGHESSYLSSALGISDREIRRWADWCNGESDEITLVALHSRRGTGVFKGLVLAPGAASRSFHMFFTQGAKTPDITHRDFYYGVTHEAVAYAVNAWDAHYIALSHLSKTQQFDSEVAASMAEAVTDVRGNDRRPVRSTVFFSCCIVRPSTSFPTLSGRQSVRSIIQPP